MKINLNRKLVSAPVGDLGSQITIDLPLRFSNFSSFAGPVSILVSGNVIDMRPNPDLKISWSSTEQNTWSPDVDVLTYDPITGDYSQEIIVDQAGRISIRVRDGLDEIVRRDVGIGPTFLVLGDDPVSSLAKNNYMPYAGGTLSNLGAIERPSLSNEFGYLISTIWNRFGITSGFSLLSDPGSVIDDWLPGQPNFLQAQIQGEQLDDFFRAFDFLIWRHGANDGAELNYKSKLESIIDSFLPAPKQFLLVTPRDSQGLVRQSMIEISDERENVFIADLLSIQSEFAHLYFDHAIQAAASIEADAIKMMIDATVPVVDGDKDSLIGLSGLAVVGNDGDLIVGLG